MREIPALMRNRTTLLALWFVAFLVVHSALAQLPPEIMADRYLVQAERELGAGDAASAVETLNRIVALQAEHGLEVPDEFWFRRAQAAQEARLHGLAVESVVRYLEIAGRDGEHYIAALELYDTAELAQGDAAWGLLPGESFSDTLSSGGEGPEMVVIPNGQFRMGCVSGQDCFNSELPVHDVTIPQAFAVSKYEVTFDDWDACVVAGGCGGYRPDDEGWGRGRRPVINVSWSDAQEYVAWLSRQTSQTYRLLSEAEWEYVARAGSSTAYSWGNDVGSNRANCDGCGSQWDSIQTASVGSFPANPFGVHDTSGNVWEWVEDCWNESYAGAPSDGSVRPSGDCSRNVSRGGAWSFGPNTLRSANRGRDSSGGRYNNTGFRVAQALAP